MKEKDINKSLFEKIGGGLWKGNISKNPVVLRADDFAFIAINGAVDTNGKEYIPVFLQGAWVWKPKEFKFIEYENDCPSQILGWIEEKEPGDETEE